MSEQVMEELDMRISLMRRDGFTGPHTITLTNGDFAEVNVNTGRIYIYREKEQQC